MGVTPNAMGRRSYRDVVRVMHPANEADAYSSQLSRKVLAGRLDFVVMSAFDADMGLRVTLTHL